MRPVFIFLALTCLLVSPARAVDDPDMAARLVAAGAPDLAMQLARTALHNKEADPAWRDVYWSAVGKSRQIPDMRLPPPRDRAAAAWVGYRLAQADQAATRQDWPAARAYWAQALWQKGAEPAAVRRAQAGIAQSWLAAGQLARAPEVANPVWLRFLSDEAEHAASAQEAALRLLDAQQPKCALDLLDALAPHSPLRFLAQSRLGNVLPAQAEAGLRAQADGVAALPAWYGLHRLAEDSDNAVLRVESLEHLIGLAPTQAHHAFELWQAYLTLAEQTANRQQWLAGMDALWLAQARARLAKSPREARALLAWLARQGTDAGLRVQAMEALADSLGGLAPQVLGNAPFALPRASEALRYRLGKQAFASGDNAMAAGWWDGVGATAASLPARAWYLRQAEINVQVRHGRQALEWLNHALAVGEPLTEEETARVVAQADALLRQGHLDGVERIAQRAYVFASPANLRGVWLLLGEVAELRGRWSDAAARYLLAAVDASDSQALLARVRAARDLERAGLIDDVARQTGLLNAAQGGADAVPVR